MWTQLKCHLLGPQNGSHSKRQSLLSTIQNKPPFLRSELQKGSPFWALGSKREDLEGNSRGERREAEREGMEGREEDPCIQGHFWGL